MWFFAMSSEFVGERREASVRFVTAVERAFQRAEAKGVLCALDVSSRAEAKAIKLWALAERAKVEVESDSSGVEKAASREVL